MNKLIKCIYWCEGGVTEQFMSAKEIVFERSTYRQAAFIALQECEDKDIHHMVYYRDERSSEDQILTAHFYPAMVGLNDEDFYKRTQEVDNGFIGAVHKHERRKRRRNET